MNSLISSTAAVICLFATHFEANAAGSCPAGFWQKADGTCALSNYPPQQQTPCPAGFWKMANGGCAVIAQPSHTESPRPVQQTPPGQATSAGASGQSTTSQDTGFGCAYHKYVMQDGSCGEVPFRPIPRTVEEANRDAIPYCKRPSPVTGCIVPQPGIIQ